MNYYFRTNFNSKIGLGHFIRIQCLVNFLKNKNCTVVIDKINNEYSKNFKKLNIKELYGKDSGFIDQIEDAKRFTKFLKSNSVVVVDDYRLSEVWEKKISNNCKKIICIDDFLNRRHYADVYINTKPDLVSCSKKKLLLIEKNNKKGCKFFLGPKHSLINPFLRKEKRSIKKFSITFYNGGSGSLLIYKDIILKFLTNKFLSIRLNLILGPLSKQKLLVRKIFKKYKNINIIDGKSNLSHVFSNTDLLIASAGVITFESSFFKIPSILINMSSDQSTDTYDLERIGHYFFLDKKDLKKTEKFFKLISIILKNYKRFFKLMKNSEIKINKKPKKILKIIK